MNKIIQKNSIYLKLNGFVAQFFCVNFDQFNASLQKKKIYIYYIKIRYTIHIL